VEWLGEWLGSGGHRMLDPVLAAQVWRISPYRRTEVHRSTRSVTGTDTASLISGVMFSITPGDGEPRFVS
jgi:hypothetical protein